MKVQLFILENWNLQIRIITNHPKLVISFTKYNKSEINYLQIIKNSLV